MGRTSLHTKYKDAEGNVVPSVTTIIGNNLGWNKGVLMGWVKKMMKEGEDPDKVRDKAASIGTIAHRLIELYLLGEEMKENESREFPPSDMEKAIAASESFKDWWASKGYEVVQTEAQYVSERYKYGGTIDLVAKDKDGNFIIIDFKTSNGVYADHKIQVAAYAEMFEEVTDMTYSEVYILKIPKEGGSCEAFPVSDNILYKGFIVFERLLDIHDLQKDLE